MADSGESDRGGAGAATSYALAKTSSLDEKQPGALLPPGAIIGKYRVVELIGRGGMGVVYRAEHVDLGMLHALKTLAPELARHPQAQARFLKEARAAARISHPHVIK